VRNARIGVAAANSGTPTLANGAELRVCTYERIFRPSFRYFPKTSLAIGRAYEQQPVLGAFHFFVLARPGREGGGRGPAPAVRCTKPPGPRNPHGDRGWSLKSFSFPMNEKEREKERERERERERENSIAVELIALKVAFA